jgi:RimJ/RimL family protein N-acetyltransferase
VNRGIPDDTTVVTERLTLSAMTVGDADELVGVLGDDRLHEFIGGRPATLDELRQRYRELVAGSGRPSELWLNWIVRRKHDQVAVGTMQATITTTAEGQLSADVAWVIGTAWQRQGFGTEAARSLVDWLRGHGVDGITAHIHPDHHASAILAIRVGLQPTSEQHRGETVWRHAERRLTRLS